MLSNFAGVGRTELVTRLLGGQAATTEAAWAEYEAGVARGLLPGKVWVGLTVISLTTQETALAANFPRTLGAGERTCLAVAISRQAELATDDAAARRAARRRGVAITGTLGVLIQAIKQTHLSRDEANAVLVEMIRRGYHSPVATLDDLYLRSPERDA